MSVPGRLEFRELAIQMVICACKLVRGDGKVFCEKVASAFGEAFNNVILHGYGSRQRGDVEIEVESMHDRVTIHLKDYGRTFDLAAVREPDLDALPEGGLGVFILRSLMDEVTYRGGCPNVLSMTKLAFV